MSQEIGGHPVEWAQKNIGVRWEFTDEQEELIYLLIRILWNPEDYAEPFEAARNVFKVDVSDTPMMKIVEGQPCSL